MNDERGSILVVSDTHFGRGLPSQLSCRPKEFTKFLEWVLQDRTVLLDRPCWTQRQVSFPRKMILLGDMLELWAPLKDRLVFENAYAPLAKLQELGANGCEIIYVVGNHDYTISDYEGQYEVAHVARVPSLRVVEDVYLDGRYVFLHGHQLVKAFRFPVWRVLGFIRRLVAALGETLERAIALSFVITLMAWCFSPEGVLMQIWVALFIMTGFILVRKLAFPAWIISKRVGRWAEKVLEWLYGKTKQRPQCKEFAEIVNEGSLLDWWNTKKGKFEESPEVIVFGHTHRYDGPIKVEDVPGIDPSKVSDELKKKLLVNTGCWLKEEDEDCTSFLYITEDNEILLCGYDAKKNQALELPGELTRFSSRQMPS
jgi:UDP-2,3-diacylglucosamine pyrophosphatase LpxH